jgi:hypothetical protein
MPETNPLERLSWLQWRPEGDLTDNIAAFEELLAPFETRMKRDGDCLLLQGWGGLNAHLEPGDCLVLDGDRLGIVRADAASDLQH